MSPRWGFDKAYQIISIKILLLRSLIQQPHRGEILIGMLSK